MYSPTSGPESESESESDAFPRLSTEDRKGTTWGHTAQRADWTGEMVIGTMFQIENVDIRVQPSYRTTHSIREGNWTPPFN